MIESIGYKGLPEKNIEYDLNKDKTKSINSTLYKYSGINQNLFSLLSNNEAWFNNPHDFNDPYDCNLNYNFSDVNYDNVYNYLLESNRKLDIVTVDYINNRAKEICNEPNKIIKLSTDFLNRFVSDMGISCFSESDSILLMWSHYADCHKGVCLTFETEKDSDFFKDPYKVDYPIVYPTINPFSAYNTKEMRQLFATKSQEWAYEKEVRIIKNKHFFPKFRGAISFKPAALREIKFGYKTSREQIRSIKNLVTPKYPHIKLYTSKIKTKEFGIEFFLID